MASSASFSLLALPIKAAIFSSLSNSVCISRITVGAVVDVTSRNFLCCSVSGAVKSSLCSPTSPIAVGVPESSPVSTWSSIRCNASILFCVIVIFSTKSLIFCNSAWMLEISVSGTGMGVGTGEINTWCNLSRSLEALSLGSISVCFK